MVTKTTFNQFLIDEVKAVAQETDRWEINNPRVIAMTVNVLEMIQREKDIDRGTFDYIKMVTLASLRVFGREDVSHNLLEELTESLNRCKECSEPPETTLSKDGRCTGCVAHEIEDMV
jgi:oligoribonuclease NrnB/cAMP/cGMP phosphodiesterase (DHH superfamily)